MLELMERSLSKRGMYSTAPGCHMRRNLIEHREGEVWRGLSRAAEQIFMKFGAGEFTKICQHILFLLSQTTENVRRKAAETYELHFVCSVLCLPCTVFGN